MPNRPSYAKIAATALAIAILVTGAATWLSRKPALVRKLPVALLAVWLLVFAGIAMVRHDEDGRLLVRLPFLLLFIAVLLFLGMFVPILL